MFNNASNVDASHSTFSEVHRDQYVRSQTQIQGNQTLNTIIHGNQILQGSSALESLVRALVTSASFDSIERHPAPGCLPGTRLGLLERLREWADNRDDEQRICWLSGLAGSGKSAVAQTVAENYAKQQRLAASFFFSRKEMTRRTAQRFFPTIASHLMIFAPTIKPAIVDVLSDDYSIPTKVLAEQMRRLLLTPLLATENPHTNGNPGLIVVDSLDECEDEKMTREVVVLLVELLRDCSWPLKVLFTSRPEAHILQIFRQKDLHDITYALQLHAFNAEDDIKSYLDQAFEDARLHLAGASSALGPPDHWPAEADVQAIVQKSSGLFIFATTVVKVVGDRRHNPVSQLDMVLRGSPQGAGASLYSDLDKLYLDVLRAYPDADKARLLLGTVVFAFSPLSIHGLSNLLGKFQVDAPSIADSLRSVLVVPDNAQDEAVRIYHTSFRDFLTNPQRSRQFFVDATVYHRVLAQMCLEVLIRYLTTDMCKLRDPTILHAQLANLSELCKLHINDGVLYACRHFAHHLSLVPSDERLNDTLILCVQGFARGYLLNWIEALSLMGELDSAIISLRWVAHWLKCTSSNPHQETLALLYDAERLVLMSFEGIQQAALQTYSALPFLPESVQLRNTYRQELVGKFSVVYGLANHWDACTRSLFTGAAVQSLAVSTGGLIAATGSFPGVKMWDSMTGRDVAHFTGRGKSSCPVCFSPSGVYVAVGYETGAIDVWDVSTGQSLVDQQTSSNQASITTIAFTRNSRLAASASVQGSVYIWELATGHLKHILAFHDGSIHCLAFSPDDSLLVSGSEDTMVMTSDVTTGRLLRKMKGHRAKVNCLTFSKDGKSIASGSDDTVVRVWDTRTGVCMRTSPKGHSKPIIDVCYTPDNKHILSVSDLNVFIWETSRKSMKCVWSLDEFLRKAATMAPIWYGKAVGLLTPGLVGRLMESDDGTPLYTAFSPDSLALAFSYSSSLFFLDSTVPALHPAPITSGVAEFTAVVISPGVSQQLVTSNSTGTVQVWNTVASPGDGWRQIKDGLKKTIAEYIRPSVDSRSYLIKTTFGLILVSAEGKTIKELESGDSEVMTAAVPSLDGRYFAYWAEDFWNFDGSASIRVYDASNGFRFKRFSRLLKIKCVAFSPKSEWLACGHGEGVVQVWELTSGRCTACVKTGQKSITSIAFLPGSTAFVCGSEEGYLTIRSIENGNVLDQSTDITVEITAITVYSPLSLVLAGCADGSLHAWNPAQATSYHLVPPNPSEAINFVNFADCPNTVTCRSNSGVVTTWDMTCCFTHDDEVDHTFGDDNGDPNRASGGLANLVSRTDSTIIHDYFLCSGYSVDTGHGWVQQGSKRIIWLPEDFLPCSPDAFSAVGKKLAILTRSGRVKILDLEPMVDRIAPM